MLEGAHGIVTYETTTAAMASEKLLLGQGYRVVVVAVPRSISTDCCQGLRIPWADRAAVELALRAAGIPYVALFEWEG